MQILVLGMHRSGTSVLTHLLFRMGCYAGSPESLKPGDGANVRGYWERWDAWALDEQILAAADASWWEVADLDLESLSESDRRRFEAHAADLVADLDEHRPWVLKDPRLCLLLPLWRPALTAPFFVIAYRDPLEIAQSLRARDGFPLAVGIALWELYTLAALRNSLGAPRLSVRYRRLLNDPRGVVDSLAAGLAPYAPGALDSLDAAALQEVVAGTLNHHRASSEEMDEFLNASQRTLLDALDEGTALGWEAVPPTSEGALEALRSFATGQRERLALSRRAAELTQRCTQAEGDAAWRRDHGVEQERWIASLRAALATLEADLGSLRRRDAEISAWNDSLTSRALAAENEAARLAAAQLAEVAGLRAQLGEARRILAETVSHAERAQLCAAELDRLAGEILSSRTWRLGRSLTAPARWGKHATLADSRHELLRQAVETLEAAARSLAEQAARVTAEDAAPEAAPGSEE